MVTSPAVLLLDTCLLLDVIRAPVRENIGTHDVTAVFTLAARQAATPPTLVFAVTQQVRDEYAAYVDSIEQETARGVEKLIKQANRMFASVAAFHSGITMPAPIALQSAAVVAVARSTAAALLRKCITIPHTVDDSHAATSRVLQARPPATQAKQSVKDCLIIEGVLRYVTEEKAAGRIGRAVFASSNTADYHQGFGSLHPLLRAEFQACDLDFAPSWSAARFEIDRLQLPSE